MQQESSSTEADVLEECQNAVAYRMAEKQLTRMPVIDGESGGKLTGMISLQDLLSARARTLNEERNRERVLRIRFPVGA